MYISILSTILSASGSPQQLNTSHTSALTHSLTHSALLPFLSTTLSREQNRKEKNIPCLNSSGFSEITQCPESISASLNLGKNSPIAGNASSDTYLLCVPLTNSAGPSNRTSPGFLKGKSPRFPRAEPRIRRGTLKRRVFEPSGWNRLPKRNWRMGRLFMKCQSTNYIPGNQNLWR